jgi:hypothetical protein
MTQPTADASGRSRGGLPSGAALAALLVIGGLLLFFTMRTTGGDEEPLIPGQPLRVLPVLAHVDGPCPAPAPDTFETTDPRGCLTVDLDGGVTMDELRSAVPERSEAGTGWQLTIEPMADDARAFSELTTRLAGSPPPGNMLAMIVGDTVLTAAQIAEPLAPGPVQISGFDSEAEVNGIAAQLGYHG